MRPVYSRSDIDRMCKTRTLFPHLKVWPLTEAVTDICKVCFPLWLNLDSLYAMRYVSYRKEDFRQKQAKAVK